MSFSPLAIANFPDSALSEPANTESLSFQTTTKHFFSAFLDFYRFYFAILKMICVKKSPKRWFRKKLQMPGTRNLRVPRHLQSVLQREVEPQRSR